MSGVSKCKCQIEHDAGMRIARSTELMETLSKRAGGRTPGKVRPQTFFQYAQTRFRGTTLGLSVISRKGAGGVVLEYCGQGVLG